MTVQVDDTPIFIDEQLIRKAMKRLEATEEFDSVRELLDELLKAWLKTTPKPKEKVNKQHAHRK